MIFKFSGYTLDIDIEKTREYYAPHDYDYYSCGCQGCRNFMKATDTETTQEEKEFFSSMGLDIRKATEIGYAGPVNDKREIAYSGFYYVSGKLVSDQAEGYVVGKRMCVYFREEPIFSMSGFPEPYVELDVTITLPFVLDEENKIS